MDTFLRIAFGLFLLLWALGTGVQAHEGLTRGVAEIGGSARFRTRFYRRDEQPGCYWATIVLLAFAVVFLTAAAVFVLFFAPVRD